MQQFNIRFNKKIERESEHTQNQITRYYYY